MSVNEMEAVTTASENGGNVVFVTGSARGGIEPALLGTLAGSGTDGGSDGGGTGRGGGRRGQGRGRGERDPSGGVSVAPRTGGFPAAPSAAPSLRPSGEGPIRSPRGEQG